MIELLQKIYKLIAIKLQKQYFVFRFYQYNGEEENKQIKISNSLEYTFINLGNTVLIINDTFWIYPSWALNGKNYYTFRCEANEIDETVYKYSFRDMFSEDGKGNDVNVYFRSPFNPISKIYPIGEPTGLDYDSIGRFNLLQVIVKERTVKNSKLKVK